MVLFCPLASGSKGNCTFVGTGRTKLLIDAGLSARSTQQRLAILGVDLSEIDAIVLTHDHIDHIAGLRVLAQRLSVPIVCNSETARGVAQCFGKIARCKIFRTGEPFEIGDFRLLPFSIQHDTGDPVGFVVETQSDDVPVKIGICTDLGFVTTLVADHLKECCCLHIEANHDPELVHLSLRPPLYKQRVLGRMGHLSNGDCADLIKRVAHPKLQRVYLAHLSEECNRQELALGTVSKALAAPYQALSILTAHQNQASTPLYLGPNAKKADSDSHEQISCVVQASRPAKQIKSVYFP